MIVEPLERRLCLSIATIGTATGTVLYQFPLADDGTAQVPLVGRWVYDDIANIGSYAAGDPVVATDLQGSYSLPLVGDSQTVRLIPLPGWTTPPGGIDTVAASPGDVVPTLYQSMSAPVVIDVLAAVTASSAQAYGPGTGISNTISSLFNYANQVLADSNTNVRINVVSTIETNYGESGVFASDLIALASSDVADIAAARRADGADLTVLFEGDIDRSAGGEIGLAYEFNRNHPAPSQGNAIVSLLGNFTLDENTLAHELGHMLGADHDPVHASVAGTAPFARGYPFVGKDSMSYRDVMSYGTSTILPFYSTPTAFYDGHVLGKSANSDNARAIRIDAPIVARYTSAGDEGPAAGSALDLAPATVVQSLRIIAKANSVVIGNTVSKATLNLTNAGPGILNAAASILLDLIPDAGSSTNGEVTVLSREIKLVLRPGQGFSLSLNILWPAGLPSGNYQLVATTAVAAGFAMDSQGNGPSTSSSLTYELPSVDLSVVPSAHALMRVRAGRVVVVSIPFLNQGNSAAVGTISFVADLTSTANASEQVIVPPHHIDTPPNVKRSMRIRFTVPSGTTPGLYELAITFEPITSVLDVGTGNRTLQMTLSVF